MNTLLDDLHFLLDGWMHPLWILSGTLFMTWTTRLALRKLHQDRGWHFIRELAPSISNIILLVGLRLATDTAPLSGRIEKWIEGILYILTVLIFLNLVQKAALIGMRWSTSKALNSKTLQLGFLPLLRNLITLFVFFTGSIMILKHFKYDVMSLVTALGVGSLAVGLASKDTLSNMISGFILIIDRNLHPGDRVNLNGNVGDVREIGLRSTQIQLGDGNTLIVPNSDLVNNKLLNLSIPSRELVCSTQIRIPYSVPFSQVSEICFSLLKEIDLVSQKKAAGVNLVSLTEGYQLLQISFWVTEMDNSGSALSQFNEQLLAQLQKENIPLAPPKYPI